MNNTTETKRFDQDNTGDQNRFNLAQWLILILFGITPVVLVIVVGITAIVTRPDADQENVTMKYGYNYEFYVQHRDTSWETEDKYPEVYTNWKRTEDTPGSREYWGLDAVRRDGEGIRKVRHELRDLNLHAYDMADANHQTIEFEPGQAYCVVSTRNNRKRTAVYFMAVGNYTKGLIDVPCEEYSVDEDLL